MRSTAYLSDADRIRAYTIESYKKATRKLLTRFLKTPNASNFEAMNHAMAQYQAFVKGSK